MNAFPLSVATRLLALQTALQMNETGEHEPGATGAKTALSAQFSAQIRQLEQQAGQPSSATPPQQFPPLERSPRRFAQTTQIAGVVVPLGENPANIPLDYSAMQEDAVDDLTLEQIAKLVDDSHLMDVPQTEPEVRAMLKRAIAGGAFKPEVVAQRQETKRLIEALDTATPDEVMNSYKDHTLRQAAQYIGLPFTDHEPRTIGVKHVQEMKKALGKKRSLEAATNGVKQELPVVPVAGEGGQA